MPLLLSKEGWNMENIIKQIYQSKELIGIIIPIIVAVIYNFILFVKADIRNPIQIPLMPH